jgi:hypothetical protein
MRLKKALNESRAAQDKLNTTADSRSTADSHVSLLQQFGGGSGRTPGMPRYRPSRKDPQVMETTTPVTNRGKSPFDLRSRFTAFAPSTPSVSNSGVSKPSTVVMKGRIATRGPLTRQGVKREGNV